MGNINYAYNLCSKDFAREKLCIEKDFTVILDNLENSSKNYNEHSSLSKLLRKLKSIAIAKIHAKSIIISSNIENSESIILEENFLSKINPKIFEKIELINNFKLTRDLDL